MNFVQIVWSCLWNSCKLNETKISVGNPTKVEQSPVPWRVSLIVLILGLASLIIAEVMDIDSLGEIARLMVYAPMGSIFGMGTQAYTNYKQSAKSAKDNNI